MRQREAMYWATAMQSSKLSKFSTNARGAIVPFPRDRVASGGLGQSEGGGLFATARAAPRLRDATHNLDYCAFAPRSALAGKSGATERRRGGGAGGGLKRRRKGSIQRRRGGGGGGEEKSNQDRRRGGASGLTKSFR